MLEDVEVGSADTAGQLLDEDLALAGNRIGQGIDDEVSPSEDGGTHGVRSRVMTEASRPPPVVHQVCVRPPQGAWRHCSARRGLPGSCPWKGWAALPLPRRPRPGARAREAQGPCRRTPPRQCLRSGPLLESASRDNYVDTHRSAVPPKQERRRRAWRPRQLRGRKRARSGQREWTGPGCYEGPSRWRCWPA